MWYSDQRLKFADSRPVTETLIRGVRLALPRQIFPIFRQLFPHLHIFTRMIALTAMMPVLLGATSGMGPPPIFCLPTTFFRSLPTTSIHPRDGWDRLHQRISLALVILHIIQLLDIQTLLLLPTMSPIIVLYSPESLNLARSGRWHRNCIYLSNSNSSTPSSPILHHPEGNPPIMNQSNQPSQMNVLSVSNALIQRRNWVVIWKIQNIRHSSVNVGLPLVGMRTSYGI